MDSTQKHAQHKHATLPHKEGQGMGAVLRMINQEERERKPDGGGFGGAKQGAWERRWEGMRAR